MAFEAKTYIPHASVVKGILALDGDVYAATNAMIDISGNVTIREGTVLGGGSRIYTHIHKIPPKDIRIRIAWKERGGITASDLIIEEDVWIADFAMILPSCNKIGRGAVIGARSVVTKDIPPYEIWVGNPARKVGERK